MKKKDEVTYLRYSTEGSPEEIKSVANFLLKSLKCNTAFAPKKIDDTSSSDTKRYKQFIVSDSLEISISIYDYSKYMNFRMGVWKKQPKPKRKLKSDFDIGGPEYKEILAMRLTEILDSLAANPTRVEKKEIMSKPSQSLFAKKPKVIAVLEYKYCNYFYHEDWIVIDVLEGTTDIAETEIKEREYPYTKPLANSSRENIDTDLHITQSRKILIKKIGEKTRYYILQRGDYYRDGSLPYSKQN